MAAESAREEASAGISANPTRMKIHVQCVTNQMDLRVAFYLPLMEMIGLLLARGWVFLVSLLCDDLGHCISDGGGAIKGYCVALSDVRFYVMYVRSVLHPTGDTSTSTTSRSTSCRARDTRYEIRSAAWYSCVLCAYRTYE